MGKEEEEEKKVREMEEGMEAMSEVMMKGGGLIQRSRSWTPQAEYGVVSRFQNHAALLLVNWCRKSKAAKSYGARQRNIKYYTGFKEKRSIIASQSMGYPSSKWLKSSENSEYLIKRQSSLIA